MRSYHHGQHITMTGRLHVTELCDVEDVIIHGDDLRAVTRLVTGDGFTLAHVMNRSTGKPVLACPHRHHSTATAQRCADSMLRTGKITLRYTREHTDA